MSRLSERAKKRILQDLKKSIEVLEDGSVQYRHGTEKQFAARHGVSVLTVAKIRLAKFGEINRWHQGRRATEHGTRELAQSIVVAQDSLRNEIDSRMAKVTGLIDHHLTALLTKLEDIEVRMNTLELSLRLRRHDPI
jgi:hypothetical protein